MKKKYLVIYIIIFYCFNLYSQKVIFMDYENGVYKIPCQVNGIPMKFILDTGASDVSISLTEASFLSKQGLLNKDDIIGSVEYQIANGEIKEGTKIVLREINIDGLILKNVKANIVHAQNAPLLLGQSAISKLGTIQIEGNKLVILPKFGRNKYKFLDIDLTKHITDFGLSSANLKNDLTPVKLSDLDEKNNHFLKKFRFDKEVVVFNKNGAIAIIALSKTSTYNNIFENKSKKEYDAIINEIENVYGICETKTERICEWKSADFEMTINLTSDNTINLFYNNLNIQNLHSENQVFKKELIISNEQIENDKSLNNLRVLFVQSINDLYINSNDDLFSVSAYVENENFIVLNKIKFDKSTYYEKGRNQKLSDISKLLSIKFINSNLNYTEKSNPDLKKIINSINSSFFNLNFNKIIFIFNYDYSGFKRETVIREINIQEFNKLNLPYEQSDLNNILK